MEAATLRCPTCGAAASSDATKCAYCSAVLMTQACPSCLALYFKGSKFCPHCGVASVEESSAAATGGECPECHLRLDQVKVGAQDLCRCSKCAGIWLGPTALEMICTREELQSTLLETLPKAGGTLQSGGVKYRKCPACQELMTRKNFGARSGVILDICKPHGVWLDKDELRRIIDFVRSGGMMVARSQEISELEKRKSALEASQMSSSMGSGDIGREAASIEAGLGIVGLVLGLFK